MFSALFPVFAIFENVKCKEQPPNVMVLAYNNFAQGLKLGYGLEITSGFNPDKAQLYGNETKAGKLLLNGVALCGDREAGILRRCKKDEKKTKFYVIKKDGMYILRGKKPGNIVTKLFRQKMCLGLDTQSTKVVYSECNEEIRQRWRIEIHPDGRQEWKERKDESASSSDVEEESREWERCQNGMICDGNATQMCNTNQLCDNQVIPIIRQEIPAYNHPKIRICDQQEMPAYNPNPMEITIYANQGMQACNKQVPAYNQSMQACNKQVPACNQEMQMCCNQNMPISNNQGMSMSYMQSSYGANGTYK